ncbi:uncharacterized protein SETTUDRAFT_25997 [Exserohilum turcica Et28A]|uniref:CCHC-type domain-containing protein n=1 Tax=Exserohilum turcicum (strain 28A) TaxID=671987 RepID=R0IYQ7_EXST2|nr:uncharacterized protein SETTUDRAFT_25997 [Exserohilum turcica Et28A]EOA89666.1 hypothetical protein SETTUDRAFT_25997 [Exserohilum turcica Et28A]
MSHNHSQSQASTGGPVQGPGPEPNPALDDEMLTPSDDEEDIENPREVKPKMATLDKYDSNREGLRTFLTTIELYCGYNKVLHDEEKILMANTHLKGKAFNDGLSAEERKKRYNSKACLHYGEVGHFRRDCPKNEVKQGAVKIGMLRIATPYPTKEPDETLSDLDLYDEARQATNKAFKLVQEAIGLQDFK